MIVLVFLIILWGTSQRTEKMVLDEMGDFLPDDIIGCIPLCPMNATVKNFSHVTTDIINELPLQVYLTAPMNYTMVQNDSVLCTLAEPFTQEVINVVQGELAFPENLVEVNVTEVIVVNGDVLSGVMNIPNQLGDPDKQKEAIYILLIFCTIFGGLAILVQGLVCCVVVMPLLGDFMIVYCFPLRNFFKKNEKKEVDDQEIFQRTSSLASPVVESVEDEEPPMDEDDIDSEEDDLTTGLLD